LYPTTTWGKVIGTILFYIGIIQLALPITILGRNFERVYRVRHGSEHILTAAEKEARRIKFENQALDEIRGNREAHSAPWFPSKSRWGSMRRRFFTLMDDAQASRLGRMINIAVMLAILLSTATFVMETDESFQEIPKACTLLENRRTNCNVTDSNQCLKAEHCEPDSITAFKVIEEICVALFLVEYVTRVFTVHAVPHEQAGLKADRGGVLNTLLYMLQPLNIIDFVAIVPYYVQKVIGSSGGGLAVLRVLRLIRVFRIFKMGKYSSGAFMVVRAVSTSIPALSMLFFLTSLACVLFSSSIYYAEGQTFSTKVGPGETCFGMKPEGCYVRPSLDGRGEEVTPFVSIPFAFWWFFTTTTTVGYGDFSPTTTAGMIVAVLTSYIGIILLALPVTIIGGNFSAEYEAWIDEAEAMETARIVARRKSQMEIYHPEALAKAPAACAGAPAAALPPIKGGGAKIAPTDDV